jgi:hypothetical protein
MSFSPTLNTNFWIIPGQIPNGANHVDVPDGTGIVWTKAQLAFAVLSAGGGALASEHHITNVEHLFATNQIRVTLDAVALGPAETLDFTIFMVATDEIAASNAIARTATNLNKYQSYTHLGTVKPRRSYGLRYTLTPGQIGFAIDYATLIAACPNIDFINGSYEIASDNPFVVVRVTADNIFANGVLLDNLDIDNQQVASIYVKQILDAGI